VHNPGVVDASVDNPVAAGGISLTVRLMTVLRRVNRLAAAAIGVALLATGCGSTLGGSAIAASTGAVISGLPSVASVAVPPSAVATTAEHLSTGIPPATGSLSIPATSIGAAAAWSAVVETGLGNGIPSPTGDLSAEFVGDRVCFVPVSGERRCGPMAAGANPTFAVFAQDGSQLLLVAGPVTAAGVYVFDVAGGTARVLGPSGVASFAAGATPPGWDLSSAVWGPDGRSVLLVPKTVDATGPVLQFDLTSGTVTQPVRMDAALANGSPSLWTTRTGLAVVANSGDQRNALWWLNFTTGSANRIAVLPESDGSIVLSSADPLGRFVLICPRHADGVLGTLTAVTVDQSRNVQILPDSVSCAGSVSSPDGAHLAVTTALDGVYSLVVVGVQTRGTELTVPLPVSSPSAPPYLTWNGDVIVAADVTGGWPVPSVVVRLKR
jgi:hypothetical protein